MKKGFFGVFVRLVIVSISLGVLGCASSPNVYTEVSSSDLVTNDKGANFSAGRKVVVQEQIRINNSNRNLFSLNGIGAFSRVTGLIGDAEYFDSRSLGSEYELFADRVEPNKIYTIYLTGIRRAGYYNIWSIDKIEGLMTIEEAQLFMEQKKAEQESDAEARRLAQEEADRYDPSKFTIVPNNFRPSRYTSIDLFTAVANVERMPSQVITSRSGALDFLASQRDYVSDVVFVSQNGTDILFRTNDNAISQTMKIGERSGLTSGQRVRVYYIVTKLPLTEWNVVAIERL